MISGKFYVSRLWPLEGEVLIPYYNYEDAFKKKNPVLYFNPYYDVEVKNVEEVAHNLKATWVFNLVDIAFYEECGDVFTEDLLRPICKEPIVSGHLDKEQSSLRRILNTTNQKTDSRNVVWMDWYTFMLISGNVHTFFNVGNYIFTILIPNLPPCSPCMRYTWESVYERLQAKKDFHEITKRVVIFVEQDYEFLDAVREWAYINDFILKEI